MGWKNFISFWIYPPIALLLLLLTATLEEASRWVELLWLFPLGAVAWSLLEYLLHRFFFHWRPRYRRLRVLLRSFHLRHHSDPRNPAKLFVRPSISLPVSALVLLIIYLLTGNWFQSAAIASGLWAGFLYYELVHYRIHLSKSHQGLLGIQRRGHFYHHFVDSRYCFGVTSPLWDLAFQTYRTVSRVPA